MNCIRCGRRIPEGQMFCEACAGVVDEPLQESAYMNKHIVLPAQREEQPGAAPTPQKPAQKKASAVFRRRLRGLTAAVTLRELCWMTFEISKIIFPLNTRFQGQGLRG